MLEFAPGSMCGLTKFPPEPVPGGANLPEAAAELAEASVRRVGPLEDWTGLNLVARRSREVSQAALVPSLAALLQIAGDVVQGVAKRRISQELPAERLSYS